MQIPKRSEMKNLSEIFCQVTSSMALAPAIEFRNLLAQLTAKETQRFITDLTQSHPQLIIELLSSRFINQSSTGTTDPVNSHCIDSISTIILSRDPDKNSIDSKRVNLNTLPLRLIGLCSSYLDQKSNRRLCLCDRSTYLGANSQLCCKSLRLCIHCILTLKCLWIYLYFRWSMNSLQ